MSDYNKAWYAKNRARLLIERRATNRRNLLEKHGLTSERYDQMFTDQRGLCAMCGQVETRKGPADSRVSLLCVDHDHISGRVRGLLCFQCNTAIGLLDDDIERLKEAITYLSQ